ncbi:CaiF/GrlA family transcriptional regulator [Budvicia aquatica]|uniref:CaiF/GrlA family transcriptional regulator n=1 Tax=Budvicia aquatica TaxID=82979 RepID=UPI002087B220|nr:CaiF/GrlA family transcriptional regulator [Budvicia aquatica]GKX53007.1 transcriptional activator CaiF [Budvicia aquatica]
MSELFDREPLYLSIARWSMQQQRWVNANEIAEQFDLSRKRVINIVSYMIAEVTEIACVTKTIPNDLAGSGCQCQRLIRVNHIDESIDVRVKNAVNKTKPPQQVEEEEVITNILPMRLNNKDKWQQFLSKSYRKMG